MEIKWGPIKGRFSHQGLLKKLVQGHKARPIPKITKWQLPPAWTQALAAYSAQGFCWQSDASNGHGATLYCPQCKNAVIFQFFDIRNRLTNPGLLQFLKTLADHRDDDCTAWRLFEVQALLPKSLQLKHYHFKPGNHELAFKSSILAVKLYRWAPASALLALSNLTAFTADMLQLSEAQLSFTSIQGNPAVEMQPPGVTGWHRHLLRWGIKPALKWVRVWHLERNNRILGISIESKKPFKPNQMAQLCANFQLK